MDQTLTVGVVPLAAQLLGVGLFLLLLTGRGRRWWGHRVPLSIVAGVAATGALTWWADNVWHPFADPVPTTAQIWMCLSLSALALAVSRPRPWFTRVAAGALAALIGVCGAIRMNAELGTYPTLNAALDAPESRQVTADQAFRPSLDLYRAPVGEPLSAGWVAPAGMAAAGVVTHASIPGLTSGFDAGDAWLYLPPAYGSTPRALLPVLILLSGQPGEPRNWFDGSNLAGVMDAYAAAHSGLAPVVVVPDWVGNGIGNPMCVDSVGGAKDFSYLTVDVRNWITATLQVDLDPAHWAVGGLSAGAICAVQVATLDPDAFPTFLAFSSQDQPTLGDHQDTVDTLFGGNEAAYDAINPIAVMARRTFPLSAGLFAVGASDADYGESTRTLYAAAAAAKMDVRFVELPGGHDSPFWASALAASMPWLAGRLEMTS